MNNYETMNTKSLTDFRNNITKYINELKQNKKPIILTQHGKNAAVVLDAKKYQEMQDELDFMRKTSIGFEDLKRNRVHDSVEVYNEIEEIINETKSVEEKIPESNLIEKDGLLVLHTDFTGDISTIIEKEQKERINSILKFYLH